MNSRLEILNHLKQMRLPEVALPAIRGQWLTFADPRRQFCQVLEAVGGRAIEVERPDEIQGALQQVESFRQAANIWSLVPAVPSVGGDWTKANDPHELEGLDYCVVPGQFGVAENAAVWVTHEQIPQRAALFITQHLVLVLPGTSIVQNMHEAYDRLSFERAQFGVFISGPSKTADIEQSLVIGAHGARSLTVLLVSAE